MFKVQLYRCHAFWPQGVPVGAFQKPGPISVGPSRWWSSDQSVCSPPYPRRLSVCPDDGVQRRHGGGVHHGPPLHQQDEVRGEVPGEAQQAPGEQPGRHQPQGAGQREGAGLLPAAHLPGNQRRHTLVEGWLAAYSVTRSQHLSTQLNTALLI